MTRKKLDNRIPTLINRGINLGHRSLFVVVGDKARDQAVVKARPSVLWCYKKELGFTSHRKKRMKQLQKKIQSGRLSLKEDDPFELFLASTEIRYCYYAETHKILGNTYGMCVLQDFEALTPNLLARTVETVEGGGLICILLKSVNSLRQLYTIVMDVHTRYRTESHQDIVARFNERFILSLAACKSCLVTDDWLNVLPISSSIMSLESVSEVSLSFSEGNGTELKQLKESLRETQPIGALLNCCVTLDQAKAVLKFLDVVTEKRISATISLTAARGRGKSAALGLAIAGAISFGYSNIFVTSPSPENLKTLFKFVITGFEALEYQEHTDYTMVQSSNPEFNKAVVRVDVMRDHRQTVQYIEPTDAYKLVQAELIVIDEAAAIPLSLVRQMMNTQLVFMASTINGYEGTGRSLSLKLIEQLRQQVAKAKPSGANSTEASSSLGRQLFELTLKESIRYKPGDDVEQWLNKLLCLDATSVSKFKSGCPVPQDCDLYYVNRDTLFSFHAAAEAFLQRLMAIYVSAHYKNSPNDLQMLSDAPAHHLFCLLGPVDASQKQLPEILCVVQVCLEGEISSSTVTKMLSRGQRASGDLLPWTVAQQFQDNHFPKLSGARIVRIATHPDYQKMGYGSKALELLENYYEGKMICLQENGRLGENESGLTEVNSDSVGLLEETVSPKQHLPPLLYKLDERPPEHLDYLGVSFGITGALFKFWKRNGYVPLYLRQTANELTGEHTCVMLKSLKSSGRDNSWLPCYWKDFRKRFIHLLAYQFRVLEPVAALNILTQKQFSENDSEFSIDELKIYLSGYDLKRLEMYSKNLVDHHLITDLIPVVAQLYFSSRIPVHLSAAQQAIILGLGLQHKSVDDIGKDLSLPANQVLALFNRCVRKFVQAIDSSDAVITESRVLMEPTRTSLQQDLDDAARDFHLSQSKKRKIKTKESVPVLDSQLKEFAITAIDEDWIDELKDRQGPITGIVSVKSSSKTSKPDSTLQELLLPTKKKKAK